jgi:hypothetical protein
VLQLLPARPKKLVPHAEDVRGIIATLSPLSTLFEKKFGKFFAPD